MSWLDRLVFFGRGILDWKPQTRPNRWTILGFVLGTVSGVVALISGSIFVNHVLFAPLVIVAGVALTFLCGFPAFRCTQSALYANRIEGYLRDGAARYLMPGAFTHVLTHPELAKSVVLVKRGQRTIERTVAQGGPRQTPDGEWQVFKQLFSRRLSAKTQRVCQMPISDVKFTMGGNLLLPAIKGEERMVADAKIGELVEIQVQERGFPLNDFLIKNPSEKDQLYHDFRDLICQMWATGFIDLDVALRNYLICVDEESEPIRSNDRYVLRVHDFGCVFRLPTIDREAIESFLDERGPTGRKGTALISNGAFLMRSLCGRLELDFAPTLIPRADWKGLAAVFNDTDSELSLQKRLKHHSNYRLIRGAHRALADAILAAKTN